MIKRLLNARLPLMVYSPYQVFDLTYFRAISAGRRPADARYRIYDR